MSGAIIISGLAVGGTGILDRFYSWNLLLEKFPKVEVDERRSYFRGSSGK